MIKVRTIGAAEVQIGRRRITASTEVVLALAVYLCVRAGERVSRDEVVAVFWPDAGEAKGRHSLRQMLYRLRQKGFVLDEEGEELWLDPGRVEVDIRSVLEANWPASAAPEEVERARQVLPTVTRTISEDFQTWLDGIRSAVALQFRRAALGQIARARSEGRWADLDKWGALILRDDPMNEEATLARAESAAMSGSKTVALEILDRYVEDLGHRAEHLALPASILRRRIAERKLEWGSKPARELPLVGRASEMRSITAALDHARCGSGWAMLVIGAPGIGKTRLCSEVHELAALSGVRTISLRQDPSSNGRSFSLAAALASTVIEVPGTAASSPSALAILRQLCDPSHESTPHAPSSPALTASTLSWALADALSAASDEGPLLIIVDDVHHADASSALVLEQIAPALQTLRIAVLMTARPSWQRTPAFSSSGWQRMRKLLVAQLSPDETERLATSLNSTLARPLPPAIQAKIVATAGGNPLFLRELALHRATQPHSATVPLTLASAIEERLSDLTPVDTRLLRLLTLLGPLATPARLFRLTAGDTSPLADSLESLERDGIIHLDPSGVLVLHDCWRDAVDERLPRAARAALALECATMLSQEGATSALADSAWRIGRLFSTAGDRTSAAAHMERAGDALLAMGLPTEATDAYRHAVEQLAGAAPNRSLLVSLSRAQHAAAQFEQASESATRALADARASDTADIAATAHACAVLADSAWKAHNDATAELARLAEIVTRPDLAPDAREYACLLGIRITFADDGKWAEHFHDAAIVTRSTGNPGWAGLVTRLIFAAERGSTAEVRRASDSLEGEVLKGLPPHIQSMVLRHRSVALRFIGAYSEAVRLGEHAAQVSFAAGHHSDAVGAAISLAFAHLDHGDAAGAGDWVDRAEEWSVSTAHDERERSFSHVKGRLLLARADFEGCMNHYEGRIGGVFQDRTQRRRAVESACIALAAVRTDRPEIADEAATLVAATLDSDQPNAQLDFAADSLVAALRALGREEEAARRLEDYLYRRGRVFQRPLAPSLRTLRRLAP